MLIDIAEFIVGEVLDYVDLEGDCVLPVDMEIVWKDGLFLCFKDPNKGVMYKKDENYEAVGIDDRRGNYIYLRQVDEEIITWNPGTPKASSCQITEEGVVNMRLISVIDNIPIVTAREKYQVEEYVRNILMGIDFTLYTGVETKVEIELTRSLINNVQILTEESKDDPKVMSLKWIFTSIDFILRFNYQTQSK